MNIYIVAHIIKKKAMLTMPNTTPSCFVVSTLSFPLFCCALLLLLQLLSSSSSSLLVTAATTSTINSRQMTTEQQDQQQDQHQQQDSVSSSSLLDIYNSMIYSNGMPVDLDPSEYTIHDPSRIITVGKKQLIAVTGKSQEDGYNCGIETWWRNKNSKDGGKWKPGQCLFRTKPDWVNEEAPLNKGTYSIYSRHYTILYYATMCVYIYIYICHMYCIV